jgi:hypothetical protein
MLTAFRLGFILASEGVAWRDAAECFPTFELLGDSAHLFNGYMFAKHDTFEYDTILTATLDTCS